MNGGPDAIFEPKISPRMSHRNREQLRVSFQLALERVTEVPECREMFADLGADGLDTLSRSMYYPMGQHEMGSNVWRGRVVYTVVGGGPIRGALVVQLNSTNCRF